MNAPTSPAAFGAAHRPSGHPPVQTGGIGVLLVNLGTPEGTDYWSIRRYLKEFLSDRRVVETNRLIWWPILNLVILSRRPQAKSKDYRAIWNAELDESPLRTITRATAQKLAAAIAQSGRDPQAKCRVDWAMRYGRPAIGERLRALRDQGCDRILLMPMYPQYCAATSATVCDKAFDALKQMRWQPTLRVAAPYFDDPVYIACAAQSIRDDIAKLSFEPEVILASFHGIPKSYFDKGDPYHCHCFKTWRLLREQLGMSAEKFMISFQSRFGPSEYLQPYTDATVKALAAKGVKRLAVVTPGFSADCLETIEEIGVENAEYFRAGGGEDFAALPCLNDSEAGIRVIQTVVQRELSGWV